MPSDVENQIALNKPTRGDYWSEMGGGICMVTGFDGSTVSIIKDRISTGHGQIFTAKQKMSLQEFGEWLSYGAIPGTWADVIVKHNCKPERYYQEQADAK